MQDAATDATLLLTKVTLGDQEALAKFLPLVYSELRLLAARYMSRERRNHTLQPTALVHEAYLRLIQHPPIGWQNRAHFLGIAAQVMRQVLVDSARRHRTEKRGTRQEIISLEDALIFSSSKSSEFLELDECLQRLAKLDPRLGRIVELRFFGGLTIEETAQVLGISAKTVKREWSMAKAWLHGNLKKEHGDSTGRLGKS